MSAPARNALTAARSEALTLVLEERCRQREEGNTEERDDRLVNGALAREAACFAILSTDDGVDANSPVHAAVDEVWPWGEGDPIEDVVDGQTSLQKLVRMCGLGLREIERRLRAGERP